MNFNRNGKGTVAGVAIAVQKQPTQPIDEFDAPAFEGRDESLPYIQMLNQQDPAKAGFFITLENAAAVQFQPSAEWELHTTTFQRGEQAEGYRSLMARMLVLRKSDLMMFDRNSEDFIDRFSKSQYDRSTMVLKMRHLVFLVDEHHQLLHEEPLLFTTKGAFCGDFGDVYNDFRCAMNQAFGQARETQKPRGDKFMALTVLTMQVRPVLKGLEKKSWVCGIGEVSYPTVDNWAEHFVGYDAATKLKVDAAFEDWSGFGRWKRDLEVPAQQSSRASVDHSMSDDDSDDVIEF